MFYNTVDSEMRKTPHLKNVRKLPRLIDAQFSEIYNEDYLCLW